MATASLITFMVLTYLLCSLQFSKIVCFLGEYHTKNKIMKTIIAEIQKLNNKKSSLKTLGNILDITKCLIATLLSAYFFENKYIMDTTAVVAHLGHHFPLWNKFKNESKNFINLILTGFVLDPITGVSMLIAFGFAAFKSSYTSVAITSATMIGMIKTVMHIFLFGNTDYIEVVFFVGFGALAISKNKKILLYICTRITSKKKKKKRDTEKPETIKTSLIKKWFFKKFGKKNILAKHIEKCISKYDENEHKDNTKEMKKNLKQSKIDKKKKLDKQFKHMIKMSKNEEFEMRNGRKGSY